MDAALAYRQVIRIAKRDSAWVYHVLEAQDGIVSYSTLSGGSSGVESGGGTAEIPSLSPSGEATCDLELTIPAGFLTQVREVLEHLRLGGVWIHELDRAEPEETGRRTIE